MSASFVRFTTITRLAGVLSALGSAISLHAGIIAAGEIAAFQSGATVQTFDSISGITAAPISNYDPLDLTGSTALFTKDPAQAPFYNSGGATFTDPASNPGTPIGIVAPTGGIETEKSSGANVAGPLGVVTPPFTLFEPGAFMEVIFPTAVLKVGLYVAHGTVQLIVKDTSNQNLETGEFSVTGTAGQFIGITRSSADIGGATLLGTGAFTIDDFTFGGASTGGGGGGNGSTSVPDTGNALTLAVAGAFLWLTKRTLQVKNA